MLKAVQTSLKSSVRKDDEDGEGGDEYNSSNGDEIAGRAVHARKKLANRHLVSDMTV